MCLWNVITPLYKLITVDVLLLSGISKMEAAPEFSPKLALMLVVEGLAAHSTSASFI